MPTFAYETTSPDGIPSSGLIVAEDERAARSILRRRGIEAQNLMVIVEESPVEQLSTDEADVLVEQLSAATEAGLPLVATLQTIAEDSDQPRLSRAARQIADSLERGIPLDQALQSLHKSLPRHMQAMVRAGIQTGRLAEAFHRYGQQNLQSRALKSLAWQSIAYPVAVLLAFLLLAMVLCYVVVPQFAEMFDEFQLDLPALTEVVVEVTDALPLVVGSLFGCLAIVTVTVFLFGRSTFHRLLGALPIVGGLWSAFSQWEFSSTLANFVSLRLSMPDALQFTSEVVSNRNVARACRKVRKRTMEGASLDTALAESSAFDRALPAAAAWSEDRGRLADVLRLTSEVYASRMQGRAAFVRRVFPTATLILIGVCVVVAIIALFLPLINLITMLSG